MLILIDNLFFAPLLASLHAQVIDERMQLCTASVDMFGNSTRSAYSHLNEMVCAISNRKPQSLPANYLWRRFKTGFDQLTPNFGLSVAIRTGGQFDNFINGDEWKKNWQAG